MFGQYCELLPGGIFPRVILHLYGVEADYLSDFTVFIVDTKCMCGSEMAYTQRQRTCYHDDELNFATLCDDCHKINDEYWQERWDEYWGSVL